MIAEAADAADREVEDDHYGTNLLVVPPGADRDAVDRVLASTARRRPEVDPETLIAHDWAEARRLVGEFVDGGITKFVVRPAVAPARWDDFLDAFVTELVPLQTSGALRAREH